MSFHQKIKEEEEEEEDQEEGKNACIKGTFVDKVYLVNASMGVDSNTVERFKCPNDMYSSLHF
jgi:hypothetical protein